MSREQYKNETKKIYSLRKNALDFRQRVNVSCGPIRV